MWPYKKKSQELTKRRSRYEETSKAKVEKPKINVKNSCNNHFQTVKKIVTKSGKIDHTPKDNHWKNKNHPNKKFMPKAKQKNPLKDRTPPDDWGLAQETATVVGN